MNEPRHLAGRAAAQVSFVFLDDDERGMKLRCCCGKRLELGVLTVTGVAEEQPEPAAARAHVLGYRQQAAQTLGVVRVIDEHMHTRALETHQPAEVVGHARAEAREHPGDGGRRYAER